MKKFLDVPNIFAGCPINFPDVQKHSWTFEEFVGRPQNVLMRCIGDRNDERIEQNLVDLQSDVELIKLNLPDAEVKKLWKRRRELIWGRASSTWS